MPKTLPSSDVKLSLAQKYLSLKLYLSRLINKCSSQKLIIVEFFYITINSKGKLNPP